jgi:ADP-heptose:LPS heptosyltransferase
MVASLREAAGVPAPSLAGRLDVAELAALLARAPLLVSNNTGPVHLAAAVGTPVVDLYALTNPQHTPWRVPHRVLSHDVPCKYCCKSICPAGHHDCLRRVEPAAVVSAALDLLDERQRRVMACA